MTPPIKTPNPIHPRPKCIELILRIAGLFIVFHLLSFNGYSRYSSFSRHGAQAPLDTIITGGIRLFKQILPQRRHHMRTLNFQYDEELHGSHDQRMPLSKRILLLTSAIRIKNEGAGRPHCPRRCFIRVLISHTWLPFSALSVLYHPFHIQNTNGYLVISSSLFFFA